MQLLWPDVMHTVVGLLLRPVSITTIDITSSQVSDDYKQKILDH